MLICSFVAVLGVLVTYILTPTYDAQTLMQEGQYLALDHKFLQPSDADMLLLEGLERASMDEADNAERGISVCNGNTTTTVSSSISISNPNSSVSDKAQAQSSRKASPSGTTSSVRQLSPLPQVVEKMMHTSNNLNTNTDNTNNNNNNSNSSDKTIGQQTQEHNVQLDVQNNFLLGDQHLHTKNKKSVKSNKLPIGAVDMNSTSPMRQVILGSETISLGKDAMS